MIGRFVEQQQIGASRDQQCQGQARFFAAREAAYRFINTIALEAEPPQMIANFLLLSRRVVLPAEIAQMPKGVAIGLELLQLLLGEIADREIRGGHAFAAQRRRFPRQQLGESGLAGTVGTQQRDAIGGAYGHVDAADDFDGTVAACRLL